MTGDPLPLLCVLTCIASLLGCRVAYLCGRGAEADRWAAAAGGSGEVWHRGREYLVTRLPRRAVPLIRYRSHNVEG